MVTINSTPDRISLAGNPVSFLVTGSNAVNPDNENARAVLFITRNGNHVTSLPNGFSFVISVNNTQYPISVYNAEGGNDNHDSAEYVYYTPNPESESYPDLENEQVLADALNNHPVLGNLFIFQTTNARFTFMITARNKGYYTINAFRAAAINNLTPHVSKAGGNSMPGQQPDLGGPETAAITTVSCEQIETGMDALLPAGYILHQRVSLLTDPVEPVADLNLSVNAAGQNQNDIGELLMPYFVCDINLSSQHAIDIKNQLLLKYQCSFFEQTGSGYMSHEVHTAPLYALPGRKNAERLAREQQTSQPDAALLGMAFLSSRKGTKTVYSGYPERLYYIMEPGWYYMIVIEEENDTPHYITWLDRAQAPDPGCIEINASPDIVKQLFGIYSNLYKVYVIRSQNNDENWEVCSDIRTYRRADANPNPLHCFVFLNCYGVPETCFLTGKKSTQLDINRSLVEVKSEEAADFAIRNRINRKTTVGSGYISKDEWEWLFEMQTSLQVWELLPDIALACTLVNTKSTAPKEGELYSHSFEYKYLKDGALKYKQTNRFPYIFTNTFTDIFN